MGGIISTIDAKYKWYFKVKEAVIMSDKKKTGYITKLMWKYPRLTIGILGQPIVAPLTLLIDPTGMTALFAASFTCVSNGAIDAGLVRQKTAWFDGKGQKVIGGRAHKEALEKLVKCVQEMAGNYELAMTDKKRQKLAKSLNIDFEAAALIAQEVQVTGINGAPAQYCFGYSELKQPEQEIPKQKLSARARAGSFKI